MSFVINIKCFFQVLTAPLTIIADGCFSRFRKDLVKDSPMTKSHFLGLVLRDCPQAMANHAEIVLADPSPILVYQISSTCTRILVDARDGMPKDPMAFLGEKVCPQLPGKHVLQNDCTIISSYKQGVKCNRSNTTSSTLLTRNIFPFRTHQGSLRNSPGAGPTP